MPKNYTTTNPFAIKNKPQLLASKRILFVFCSIELGGAERQGLHLARHFKNMGCDVRVWSNHAGPGLVVDHCNDAGIPWAIRRFRWPCRKSSLIRDSLRMVWALRQERPDVIIAYTTWPNVGRGLTWRWSPAKVCIWGQRNTWQLRGDAVERFAYRRVSGVICNASHEVAYLGKTLGKTEAPVYVVHNGLEMAHAAMGRKQWRAFLDLPENALVVVMVANFRPEKDHVLLLQAWSKVMSSLSDKTSQTFLVLAGAPQFTHTDVKRLVEELGGC